MKNSMMACTSLSLLALLAGCRSAGDNPLAAHDKTIEYYRVFDIRTDAAAGTVAQAASEGLRRNVKDAVVATPPGGPVGEVPGRFHMAEPATAGSGTTAGPTCEGASWTARATPTVRFGDNMNFVACLFPYRNGYHLDMYTVFTRPEGGLMAWPRRIGGNMLGTPEAFTETAMTDLVRAIRDSTGATVSLVEARPALAGAPWMGTGPGRDTAVARAAAPTLAPAAAPATTAAATTTTTAAAPSQGRGQGAAQGTQGTAAAGTPEGLR